VLGQAKHEPEPLLQYIAPQLGLQQSLVLTHVLLGTLRILVFSGDVDGILPVVGTRRWVAGLGLPTKSAWRPWLSLTGQVGGHVIVYEGLTFASVRNAGHMVSLEGNMWLSIIISCLTASVAACVLESCMNVHAFGSSCAVGAICTA
jgi:hypothetical protein